MTEIQTNDGEWYEGRIPLNDNSDLLTAEEIDQLLQVTVEGEVEQIKTRSKWISVNDKLPEIGQRVFVTCYGDIGIAVMRNKDGNFGYPVFWLSMVRDKNPKYVQETTAHGEYSKNRITAWMPIEIPEPYKEDEE